jgi:Fe-S cluster assembly protein SufD
MIFKDISTEDISTYTLKENEQCIFFLLNRSGEITFELAGEHAKAHIFAFALDKDSAQELSIIQKHTARHTTSEVMFRSVLSGKAESHYRGLIHITKSGNQSTATQESRALLLSKEARHTSIPSLEILPRDVICHHKASATPFNQDSLYYLESRGLTKEQASRTLINGFIETSFEAILDQGVTEDMLKEVRQNISEQIQKLYA